MGAMVDLAPSRWLELGRPRWCACARRDCPAVSHRRKEWWSWWDARVDFLDCAHDMAVARSTLRACGCELVGSRTVVDEGMTPRVLNIGLPATTEEQDGHSKPKKSKTN
jgi:hypothetical protein